MNVEIETAVAVAVAVAQFPEKEYINRIFVAVQVSPTLTKMVVKETLQRSWIT